MNFEEARNILFQWNEHEIRVLEAWETRDEFIFLTRYKKDIAPFWTGVWEFIDKKNGIPHIYPPVAPGEQPPQIQNDNARRIV